MRGHTVTVEVNLVRGKVAKTIALYQYDYGQKLIFTNLELPANYEVHFANEMHGDALTSIGDDTGVLVPDSLLATGKSVYFWLYMHETSSDGETEYQGVIPIIKRAQVTDQEPTPTEQSAIAQAIELMSQANETLQEAIIAVEGKDEDAEAWAAGTRAGVEIPDTDPAYENNSKFYALEAAQQASDASDYATSASGYATDASGYATDASGYAGDAALSATGAGDAQTAAETAQGKAETAQGKAEAAQALAEAAQGNAEDEAENAEAWAVGSRDGTPVGSSDTTYHNNSKYYAEQAAASATTAEEATVHEPQINTTTGKWAVWDQTEGDYVDTDTDAQGPQGEPGSISNAFGDTLQMSENDTTKISEAIAGKADLVASATSGNFAGLDAYGNLTDSGYDASDFTDAIAMATKCPSLGSFSTIAELSTLLNTALGTMGTYCNYSFRVTATATVYPFDNTFVYYGVLHKGPNANYCHVTLYPNAKSTVIAGAVLTDGTWVFRDIGYANGYIEVGTISSLSNLATVFDDALTGSPLLCKVYLRFGTSFTSYPFVSGETYYAEISKSGTNTYSVATITRNGSPNFIMGWKQSTSWYFRRDKPITEVPELTSALDMDGLYNISDSGIYYVTPNTVNKPSSVSYASALIIGRDGPAWQVIFASGRLFCRSRVGNPLAWNDWKLYTSYTDGGDYIKQVAAVIEPGTIAAGSNASAYKDIAIPAGYSYLTCFGRFSDQGLIIRSAYTTSGAATGYIRIYGSLYNQTSNSVSNATGSIGVLFVRNS